MYPYGTPDPHDRAPDGPLSSPLFRATTSASPDAETVRALGVRERHDEFYSRYGHPNARAFESSIAALEGAEGAVSFASGMAAMHAVLCGLVSQGERVLIAEQVYGGTVGLATADLPRFGIEVEWFDAFDPRALHAALSRPARLCVVETPVNPTLRVVDLQAVAAACREAGTTTLVDATFAPPPVQRSLDHGVDLVLHSATKFLGGHSDVLAGVVAGPHRLLRPIEAFRARSGGILAPDSAWLLCRSAATLALRLAAQQESAAAVAGGLADFALGSDTLGSVRVPASYCGIYGIRPTHGRIPAEGLVPLAPSFDTIGWFARDPKILLKVGRVLFGEKKAQAPSRLLIPEDAWDLANPEVKEALSPFVKKIGAALGAAENIRLTEDGLEEWLPPARHLLGWEVWQAHGPWVEKERPAFGPHIEARFEWAAAMPAGKAEAARTIREAATRRMRALLTPGTLMAIPTAPGIAPVKNMEGPELEAFRHRLIQLTSIASVSGVPQISLPLGKVEGCPVGLSLIAGAGEDEALLEMAVRLRDS